MLNENDREKLRHLTVELVLTLRVLHLQAGGSPLKHWSAIQDRLRAAARTCGSVEELGTKLARDLQIADLGKHGSRALTELADMVREKGLTSQWLDLLESEHSYIMALARLTVEQRKEEKQNLPERQAMETAAERWLG
jgi:hypothetical protein